MTGNSRKSSILNQASYMKRKLVRLMLALLLPVMAGCSGMDTIRMGQDRPEDLDRLLAAT